MNFITKESIYFLIQESEKYDYEFFGLRVIETDENLDGEILPASHVWVDGECTEELLDGTCAIELSENAATLLSKYFGNTIVLLGANQCYYGEDEGELVLRDAIVLHQMSR